MAKAFELRDELKSMVTAETILCRCEDVRAGEVARATSWNEAKLHTRCGMGSCQGRVCGAATNHLFGWGPTTVRPPLVPIPIENLMNPRSAS